MKISKIVLFLLLISNIFALDVNSIQNDTSKFANNVYEKNKHNWYSYQVEFGFTGLKNSTFNNENAKVKEINANPTFAFSAGLNLLPDTYNINVSYTYLMDNRSTWGENEYRGEGYGDKISFINFSFIPLRTTNGNIGFGYKEHIYAIDTTPDDKSQTLDIIDIKNDGKNPSGYENNSYIVYGQTNTSYLISQQEYKRYTLIYTLPYGINYIPDGFGISLAHEKGTRPYEGKDFLALKTEYDGTRIGLGINKDDKDLGHGFSLKKFNFYIFNYNQNIPYSYRTEKSIDLGKVEESGLETEFMYRFKNKGNRSYYIKFNMELAKAEHNVISEDTLNTVYVSEENMFNGGVYLGVTF